MIDVLLTDFSKRKSSVIIFIVSDLFKEDNFNYIWDVGYFYKELH